MSSCDVFNWLFPHEITSPTDSPSPSVVVKVVLKSTEKASITLISFRITDICSVGFRSDGGVDDGVYPTSDGPFLNQSIDGKLMATHVN